MVKYELRQNGFSEIERINKKSVINILWAVFTAALIFGAVIFILFIIGYVNWEGINTDSADTAINLTIEVGTLFIILVKLIGIVFLYLALKFIVTILFCVDKYNSIKFRLLENNNFPVCHCKEAFRISQVVAMYLIPVIIGYAFMLGVCAYQYYIKAEMSMDMITLIILAFFIAFDLTLVVYVLYIKFKENLDYISIDHHIYSVTLFKGTYVRTVNKKEAKKRIKDFYNRKNFKTQKKAFEKMFTCGNMECENYGCELDETEKICPICGASTGKFAMTFTGMKTCLNPDCDNYGYELRDNPEECLLCGSKTGQFAFKINNHLTKPVIISALVSVVVFGIISWLMYYYEVMGAPSTLVFLTKLFISAVIIGFGISGKSKAAISISIIALILNQIISFIIYFILM